MTREKLIRANELWNTINGLVEKQEKLKEIRELCWRDTDTTMKGRYTYSLNATPIDGGYNKEIEIYATGALQAVDRDILDIEKEIKKLNEEFDKL